MWSWIMSKKNDIERDDSALEHVFSEWLTNKESRSRNKETLDSSPVWHQRALVAEQVEHFAEVTADEQVPEWDRGASFESDSRPWWQWQGLPAMSFACSLFAMSLVLFNVEVNIQEQGVTISFAGNNQAKTSQYVETLLDQKLQSFANEQQVVLANYAADISAKQQEGNLQLASYILGASRQERKEDMNDFIKYINDQRQDDQLDQQLKFKRFAETILYQSASISPVKNDVSSTNWITEE